LDMSPRKVWNRATKIVAAPFQRDHAMVIV